MTDHSEDLHLNNYAAAFIDLLGQKETLKDCSLIPQMNNNNEKEEFIKIVRNTIGAIQYLHETCEEFFNTYKTYDSGRKQLLPEEQQSIFEEMKKTNIKFQRFSDGLVAYLSLGDKSIKVLMSGVFSLMATCGSLCLLCLAKGNPIRIGMDIAWGAELNENELYGCIISKTHSLESDVAQYPRTVVGEQFVGYLVANSKEESQDVFTKLNKVAAEHCLEMISVDVDGHYIIDYLGGGFKKHVAAHLEPELYQMAYDYVTAQLDIARKEKNSKLGFRYDDLRNYFEKNRAIWGNANSG